MQDKLLSEDEAVAFSSIYELLAGSKRELERLLHLAKQPGSTVHDLSVEGVAFFEKVSDLELALAVEDEEVEDGF